MTAARQRARNQCWKYPFLRALCCVITLLLLLRCCENTSHISSEVSQHFEPSLSPKSDTQLADLAGQISQSLPPHFSTFHSSSNFSCLACVLYSILCYLLPHLSHSPLSVITTLSLMFACCPLVPSYMVFNCCENV